MQSEWLSIRRGAAPLLLSMPHSGIDLRNLEPRFVSPWLARRDADWHLDRLYDFATELDATIVRTTVSRSVIDVNRDPSGRSLYPGRATTELCPSTTFDGEPLYRDDPVSSTEIEARRQRYFDPYHATLRSEIERLRQRHANIVLYDCHSIRSRIPRLFEGELPQFNIGTNDGQSCAPALSEAVAAACASSSFSHVLNGRFKGGYITRCHGQPAEGVHAVQMELACRGYLDEPGGALSPDNWPPQFDPNFSNPLRTVLKTVLGRCIEFALKPVNG
ncbi:N-formylglutamate deformylase [Steroidobacter agaridevorans]|uniref:N-formylglutamate deformylase n=1 Tax=Steroidobacter agaridevorans TaxID=2695856 RepID=A0A829YGA5_9GAMM|nr:N-formylglutamate deformylase [Steroidobacter agaridevorans]GFE82250.1 N-formylglutamate deformylase [Steroidobacter agaridevorans]